MISNVRGNLNDLGVEIETCKIAFQFRDHRVLLLVKRFQIVSGAVTPQERGAMLHQGTKLFRGLTQPRQGANVSDEHTCGT